MIRSTTLDLLSFSQERMLYLDSVARVVYHPEHLFLLSINNWFSPRKLKAWTGALSDKIEQVILDFRDVWAFSSEAMVLLSRKGLLRAEEGDIWMAITHQTKIIKSVQLNISV